MRRHSCFSVTFWFYRRQEMRSTISEAPWPTAKKCTFGPFSAYVDFQQENLAYCLSAFQEARLVHTVGGSVVVCSALPTTRRQRL